MPNSEVFVVNSSYQESDEDMLATLSVCSPAPLDTEDECPLVETADWLLLAATGADLLGFDDLSDKQAR